MSEEKHKRPLPPPTFLSFGLHSKQPGLWTMLLAQTQILNAELISNKHQTLWMSQKQERTEEEILTPKTARGSAFPTASPTPPLPESNPSSSLSLGLPCPQPKLSHISHFR